MTELVRLRIRPSRDGRSFTYFIDYADENGKRKRISLGHADKRKAQKQRDQKERELRMGVVERDSMRLSEFFRDSIERTRSQVRESSIRETGIAIQGFIDCVGDIDYRKGRRRLEDG